MTNRTAAGIVFFVLSTYWLASCTRSSSEPRAQPQPQVAPIQLNSQFPVPTDGARTPEDLTSQRDSWMGQSASGEMMEIAMEDLLLDAEAETGGDGANADIGLPSHDARSQIAKLLAESRALLRQQDPTAAAKLAWNAWKQSPTGADQIADIAEILIRSKKLGPAIVVAESAIADDRANSKSRVLLAQAYLKLARETDVPDEALSHFQKSSDALFDLQRNGQLKKYGRSGAMLLLAALTEQAKLAAKLVRRDDCLDIMQQLYDRGFAQVPTLVGEPEFKTLNRDPIFAQRIAAFRAEIRERLNPEIERRMAATEPFDFDIDLQDVAGRNVSLDDFHGKVVVVDFWGTWCGPCRMEIPHLARLAREYRDDLEVIGIAYEKALPARWPRIVSKFVRENEVPYTCVIGDNATKSQVPGFRNFPTILFLDRAGTVRLKLMGYHGFEQLDAIVNLLMTASKRG